MGRATRHAALNDIIRRALSKADVPSSMEPSGLSRTDDKRPDGATLIPWTRGRFIAWDTTPIHTCAASYIHLTSTVTCGAAEQAAERKTSSTHPSPLRTYLSRWPLNHLAPSTGQRIYTTREWEIRIDGARKSQKPYCVKSLKHNDFMNLKLLSNNMIQNRTKTVTGETVN
jgi:hypothetical protein